MSEEKELSKFQQWLERVRHPYRLVVMNHDTFEEVGSYKLTLMSIYVLFSTIVVLVALLVISAVVFTPIKRFIPGYGDGSNIRELMAINAELDSIRYHSEAIDIQQQSLFRVMADDPRDENDVPELEAQKDTIFPTDASEEERNLVSEVELETINKNNQSNRGTNTSVNEASLEQIFFTSPVKGEVRKSFDLETKHFGVDVLAPIKSPIKSVVDGRVIQSDWTQETGNTIAVQHANNMITFYKHNSVLLKKIGDYVKAGEAVAIIGNTGELTDGPHLHFELWYKGQPVDPTEYINFN